MLPELDDYDWAAVFHFADGDDVDRGGIAGEPNLRHVPKGATKPFSREDVTHILGSHCGENDGEPWRIVVKLNDGRYAYLEASCDYTGWD